MFTTLKTKVQYDTYIRLIAGLFAIVFWFISVWFSSKGFNIAVPNYVWIGYVLGLGVTVLELVGNRGYTMRHLIIAISVVLAYCYGIWTNVTGIAGVSVASPGPIHYIIGTLLEVVPEPLLLFAILGKDFVEKSWIDKVIPKPADQKQRSQKYNVPSPEELLLNGYKKAENAQLRTYGSRPKAR